MDVVTLALVLTIAAILFLAMRWEIAKMHPDRDPELPVLTRPMEPVAPPPKVESISTPRQFSVMLEGDKPRTITVARRSHRIYDSHGHAWDRHGTDSTGCAVYRRAHGQGVER